MENKTLFVTGIGTDVGKTIVSAILCEYLKANYWKPVQAGDLDNSDSIKIRNLCSNDIEILIERFRLNTSVSPHFAAELDGVDMGAEHFELVKIDKNLVIEGAGGLMVPLNNEGLLYLDIIKNWKIPVVLVSRHYLGSINHTLLSIEILKQNEIEIELLVFVGNENKATEQIILKKYPFIKTLRVPIFEEINKKAIKHFVESIKF